MCDEPTQAHRTAAAAIYLFRFGLGVPRTLAVLALAIMAAVCLFRLKLGVVRVLGVSAAAGVALHLMGAI